MKFGAVPDIQLSSIDLSLPPVPDSNHKVLEGKRSTAPKAYLGTANWGHTSWIGKIYPPKTLASQYRQVYPQYFNAVELNATHYNIYPPATIRQWAASAKGKDFKFCPKFPQQISHNSNFRNAEQATAAFLESILAFEENLGPVFLQLSEFYAPTHKAPLFEYLASLPKNISFFLEVRHPAWFAQTKEREELFAVLQQLNIGAVITDAPGRRDIVHMQLTVPKLFLRFVCNATHSSSFNRTNDWVQCLRSWFDQGLEEAYIFLHPGDETAVPDLFLHWVQELNSKCNMQLKKPVVIQPGLF